MVYFKFFQTKISVQSINSKYTYEHSGVRFSKKDAKPQANTSHTLPLSLVEVFGLAFFTPFQNPRQVCVCACVSKVIIAPHLVQSYLLSLQTDKIQVLVINLQITMAEAPEFITNIQFPFLSCNLEMSFSQAWLL